MCQIATVQSISGTGALRVGAEFVRANLNRPPIVYLPDPTYVNHIPVRTHFRFGGQCLMHAVSRSSSCLASSFVAIVTSMPRPRVSTSRVR